MQNNVLVWHFTTKIWQNGFLCQGYQDLILWEKNFLNLNCLYMRCVKATADEILTLKIKIFK